MHTERDSDGRDPDDRDPDDRDRDGQPDGMLEATGHGPVRYDAESATFHVGTPAQPDWLGAGQVVDPSGAGVVELVDVTPGGQRLDACTGHDGVHAVAGLRLTATAPTGCEGTGPGTVGIGIRFATRARAAGACPPGMRAFGHQWTEFGLPIQSDEHLLRWYHLPFRPAIVLPLWLCDPEGTTLLLAPLDTFHEQVVTFPDLDDDRSWTDGLAWGWHGDLTEIPAGFNSTLAVLSGDSPRGLLAAWSSLLEVQPRLPVDHDTLGRTVSYWTDNGAAYWYRTGGDDHETLTVPETLTAAVSSVEIAGVPIGAVQLDSWFYPHEHTRPFDTEEWVVPPSGLRDWAPREDILPDGIDALRHALGDRPLVTHCRHLWSGSPLAERFACWEDHAYAHPKGADYYEHLLDRAVSWGVETFEHDWLVECWAGVRGLRGAPGRPREWQEGIDRAARVRDLTLQWCMATPADFLQSTTLQRVTSIRTSGDHGYLVGPGFLWAWFCYTNALARVLGLAPFKDVFLSDGEHAEVEALLSALSTGPVGVGDAIGTTDAAVVLATCRADGTIVRPDVPVAAVDACFRRHAVSLDEPLVAECHTDHAAGRWVQVFCANTWRKEQPLEGTVDLGPAWPERDVAALDLRTGAMSFPDRGWDVGLEPAEWTHHLLAPVLAGGLVVFGDVSKHAPVGRTRISGIDEVDGGVHVTVAGPRETVTVSGALATGASGRPVSATAADRPLAVDQQGDRWSVAVHIDDDPVPVRITLG